jgi:hypothetical protein
MAMDGVLGEEYDVTVDGLYEEVQLYLSDEL